MTARLSSVGKVAENRQGKLLEGRVVADDGLEERDGAGASSFFLSRLAEAA